MLVGNKNFQSIWLHESDLGVIRVIDQGKLPFSFEIKDLRSVDDVYNAIKDMTIRGAPLIGAAGAFGMYLSTLEINNHTVIDSHIDKAAAYLISARPTAVNLSWAVKSVKDKIAKTADRNSLAETALSAANEICGNEKENCRNIGLNGLSLIKEIKRKKKGSPVNILTHCNAGWLACVDYGTALAPVYLAHESGIAVHVWVDETRPRNQGSRLTAWELQQAGVPFTLIADNTGGYLMQQGMVDLVLVGSDRTTRTGDVANKIGTYLKALAAFDNNIPFYAAMPMSSIDLDITDGIKDIHIEKREAEELIMVEGISGESVTTVRICAGQTPVANYGFDITPARYITGLITEKGICKASEKEIIKMFYK